MYILYRMYNIMYIFCVNYQKDFVQDFQSGMSDRS
jgi:hypothetical protein